jgi:hypothetical protein
MLAYGSMGYSQYGTPQNEIERIMNQYGVNRRQAERMHKSGVYLPVRGTGVTALSGIGADLKAGFDEIKNNPIPWLLILGVAIWVFTRKN